MDFDKDNVYHTLVIYLHFDRQKSMPKDLIKIIMDYIFNPEGEKILTAHEYGWKRYTTYLDSYKQNIINVSNEDEDRLYFMLTETNRMNHNEYSNLLKDIQSKGKLYDLFTLSNRKLAIRWYKKLQSLMYDVQLGNYQDKNKTYEADDVEYSSKNRTLKVSWPNYDSVSDKIKRYQTLDSYLPTDIDKYNELFYRSKYDRFLNN